MMITREETTAVLASFGSPGRPRKVSSRLPMPIGALVSPRSDENFAGPLNRSALRDIVDRAAELVISTLAVPGMPDGVSVAHEDGTFGHLGTGHQVLAPGTAVLSLLGDIETAVAEHGGHGYRLLLSAAGRYCASMARAAGQAGLTAERCRPIPLRELRPLVPADGGGRAVLCGLLLRTASTRPSGQEESA